jgi:crossover junction endodeoxyribonuclease RuvC
MLMRASSKSFDRLRAVTVIGIDPGLARTGIGIVEYRGRKFRLIHQSVIRSSTDLPMASRLLKIHEGIREVTADHQIDTAAIESVFVGRSVRSALALGHARAAALLALASAGLTIGEYSPAEVKRAVGAGGAGSKEQVHDLVRMLLAGAPERLPNDAADALAVAICHVNRTGGGR